MTGFIHRLTAYAESDGGHSQHDVESPNWLDIESAIRDLDGRACTEVYLQPHRDDPETYLAIAGGSDGHYLVFVCHRNERFDEAITPDAPQDSVRMVAGGQPGEFTSRDLVSLDEALEAVDVHTPDSHADHQIGCHNDHYVEYSISALRRAARTGSSSGVLAPARSRRDCALPTRA